jgi:hypothetical protein
MVSNVVGFYKKTGDIQVVNLPPKSMKVVLPHGVDNPYGVDVPVASVEETILDVKDATEDDIAELKHFIDCANVPTRTPPKKQRKWLVR